MKRRESQRWSPELSVLLQAGRPGPVVLALPEDMLFETVSVDDAQSYRTARACPSSDAMEKTAGHDE